MSDGIITKICTKCKIELTLDKFSKHNTAKYGRNSVCIKCDGKRAAKWQKDNRDKYIKIRDRHSAKESTKRYRRNWQLVKDYNITLDEVEQILYKQDFKCKICSIDITNKYHVDHCHKNNVVRGLLCQNCNRGIGIFKENINILKNAILYLEVL